MTPPPAQDGESSHKLRARANTNSTFPSFSWRRGRESTANTPGTSSSSPQQPHHTGSIHELLASLTPPAVPSLATARALALALSSPSAPPLESLSSIVTTTSLIPVITELCAPDRPLALRNQGFEILAAYMDLNDVHPLSTSDRVTFCALFADDDATTWEPEVWDSRARALKNMVKGGEEVLGIELPVIRILQTWIETAYSALLVREGISVSERTERERCIESLSSCFTEIMSRPETLARVSEPDTSDVLAFFASMVERALSLPSSWFGPMEPVPAQNVGPSQTTPTRLATSHRRHPSSASIALASPTSATPFTTSRRPLDVSVPIYLAYLSSQLRTLSPVHLQSILSMLFRALAFYSSPLPRLSISPISHTDLSDHPLPLERKIVEMLGLLLNGPYTTACFLIVKRHLLPPSSLTQFSPASLAANPTPPSPAQPSTLLVSQPLRTSVQSSIGATRTLRLSIRRALCSRLARSYIAGISADTYAPSGAPSQLDIMDTELMERAWAQDEVTKGDLRKVGRVLRKAAEAWAGMRLEEIQEFGGEAAEDATREDVLLEIAGVLKDVFQEYDQRGDREDMDEEEASVVGEILQALCAYVAPLKCVPSIPLYHCAWI